MMKAYELKITLMDESGTKAFRDLDKKCTWFTVIVPENFLFSALNQIIMECTNWVGRHLFAFDFKEIEESIRYNEGGADDSIDPAEIEIGSLFKHYKKCDYIYDYGDNWLCEIKVINTIQDYAGAATVKRY